MSPGNDRQPPIWILVLGLVVAAGAVALLRLDEFGGFEATLWWHWPLLLAGFAIAESIVVRVHFGSEASAATFVEMPLFLAALFIDPTVVWISMTLGVAISMLMIQRLQFMKAVFNIANLSLQGAAGLWIFHSLINDADPLGPPGWSAAVAAAAGSSALGVCALMLVLLMVSGPSVIPGLRVTLLMGAVSAITNVSLALLAASLISYRPVSLLLLVLPTVVLYGAYSAYTSERAQRDRVQALHDLSLEVRSIRNHEGIAPVLRLAAERLSAKRADLVLFPDERGEGVAMRFSAGTEGEDSVEVVSTELAAALDSAHAHGMPTICDRSTSSRSESVRDAHIVGAISGEERPLGLLTISGRLRDSSDFSADDLVVFSTVVEQLGLTIEKNQLGHAVNQLERRSEKLQHEVYHDALTGLANRTLLAAKLDAELEHKRRPSLLYVDLDDFKDVNDQYGHDAGDHVLTVVARRFESAVGTSDCVARLGGDEFAVLLGAFSDDVGVANALLHVASEPIEVTGAVVTVHASIGIARAGVDHDSASLLKRADVAMYSAKENGKGSLAFA